MSTNLLKIKQESIVSCKKSFITSISEGYIFNTKDKYRQNGTRCIYYHKPEHTLLISHIASNRVHLINLSTGQIRWFDHHLGTVRDIIVHGNEILSSSWDGTVCVTNFHSLNRRMVLTGKGMGRSPQVILAPDCKSVYAYSYDSDKDPQLTSNTIRRWDLTNGTLTTSIQLRGIHRGTRRCGSLAVDQNRLYVVSDTGFLQIFNTLTDEMIGEWHCEQELQSICVKPESGMLFFGGQTGHIFTFDTSNLKILANIKCHLYDISSMVPDPVNDDILYSIAFDGRLKAIKIPEMQQLASVDITTDRLWTLKLVNDLIVTGGDDGEICVFKLENRDNLILRGKLKIFNKSYVFLTPNSDSFYTNDLSLMKVTKKDTGTEVTGHEANDLLNCCNNLSALHELFDSEGKNSANQEIADKVILSLSQNTQV